MPWYEDYFTADYWSYADAEYTAGRTQAEVSYLADVLRQHAPGRRVLDLGCGTGRHAVGLARLGFEVTGVDLSEYALERARLAAADAGVRLRLRRADLLGGAGWAAAPADAVICVQAFGWGQDGDQLRLLRRVRRLLPPGGLLVLDHSSLLAISRMYSAHAEARIGASTFTFSRTYDPVSGRSGGEVLVERPDGSRAVLPDNVRLYTPAEVADLLARAGFELIRADADFGVGVPVTISTRYVQFLATPAASVEPALAGHEAGSAGSAGPGDIDLRWAPDEAEFTREELAAAWARLAAGPDRARRYDLSDPYGGERAAPVLARHLGWPGPAPGAERVSVGAGVTGLLNGLARLADGGTVLMTPDGHSQLAEAAAAVGGQVAVAGLPDLAAAAAAIAATRPAVTVLDRPGLTGSCWPPREIAGLAACTAEVGGVLVVDESYGCYRPAGDSAAPLTDSAPGLVVLRGVSKGYCCGGLRIGFAVASADIAPEVRAVLAPLAFGALAFDLALELLAGPDPFGSLRARVAEVKPALEAAVRRAGIEVIGTDKVVPWIALPDDSGTRSALATCGLVAKRFSGRPGGLLRMSVPLSRERADAVFASLAQVSGRPEVAI
jgi:histidinol-phosphate/aromatic aminotransferase/cobyric acid decarboxylase-like protein/ubiquinone/menaquinone biosynthesis C-methylase UbiE